MKKLNSLNLGKSLDREEMKSINGGTAAKCTMTSAYKILYSPEGQAVSEACGWNCGGDFRWGGCGL